MKIIITLDLTIRGMEGQNRQFTFSLHKTTNIIIIIIIIIMKT